MIYDSIYLKYENIASNTLVQIANMNKNSKNLTAAVDKHGEMNTEKSSISKNWNQIWMTLTPKTYLSWTSKEKISSTILMKSNRSSINWKNFWISMMPGLPLHTNCLILNSKDCLRHIIISYQDSLLRIGWQASQHLQNVIIKQKQQWPFDNLQIMDDGRQRTHLQVGQTLNFTNPVHYLEFYTIIFSFPLKFKWNKTDIGLCFEKSYFKKRFFIDLLNKINSVSKFFLNRNIKRAPWPWSFLYYLNILRIRVA